MTLDKAIEAYLREAMNGFRDIELKEYVPANVDRDLLAVSRFVDFLFGKYKGKEGR